MEGLNITAEEFRSLMSAEYMDDIAGGLIPVHTLAAYAKTMTEWLRTGRLVLMPAVHRGRV